MSMLAAYSGAIRRRLPIAIQRVQFGHRVITVLADLSEMAQAATCRIPSGIPKPAVCRPVTEGRAETLPHCRRRPHSLTPDGISWGKLQTAPRIYGGSVTR